MKAALVARELEGLAKAGIFPKGAIPGSERRIQIKALEEAWPRKKKEGQGGGWVYPIAELPQPIREAIMVAVMRRHPEALRILEVAPIELDQAAIINKKKPELQPPDMRKDGGCVVRAGRRTLIMRTPPPGAMTTKQSEAMAARAAILAEISRAQALSGRSFEHAAREFAEAAKQGDLSHELTALIQRANARNGGRRTICRRTLRNWRAIEDMHGVEALAPTSTTKTAPIPPWAGPLMQLWADPRKPALSYVLYRLSDILPPGVPTPTRRQADYFLKKLSVQTRLRGRLGPNALRAYEACVRRSFDDLWPTAVYVGDGHTLKAKVEHPVTGALFQPEITTFIDVYSRAVVGWSVGVVENSLGVLEALSAAMAPLDDRPGGCPTIVYSDLGKGFQNRLLSEDVLGFYARWGITEEHSRARNSQARGVIEHFHAAVYTPLAKSLPTYCGPDMDKDALRLINKANSAAESDGKSPRYSVSWPQYRDALQAAIDAHNARPHSALPEIEIEAPVIEKRRMTPLERWAEGVEQTLYKPIVVSQEAKAELTRPYLKRRANRGEVRFLNNIYFSRDLIAWGDCDVGVGFDVHDGSKVYVRTIDDGRLIAVATLNGNSRPYFSGEKMAEARSFFDEKMRERTKGRLNRNDAKRAEILAEAGTVIDPEAQAAAQVAEQVADARRVEAGLEALRRMEAIPATAAEIPLLGPPEPPPRPIFRSDLELARWAAAHPGEISAAEATALRAGLSRKVFMMQLKAAGVDPRAVQDAIDAASAQAVSAGSGESDPSARRVG